MQAVYDPTKADCREQSPPRYEFTAEARKACFGLLGLPPEPELHDFIRYSQWADVVKVRREACYLFRAHHSAEPGRQPPSAASSS
jgi:hypothetical protein